MKVIPKSLGGARQLVEEMRRDLDDAPPDQLREIQRTAEIMRSLYWDVADDIRERRRCSG
jgi:hypothetical protein